MGNDVFFVIVTGRGDPEARETSLENGADMFFEKKGDPKVLYHELAEAIVQEIEKSDKE